MYCYIHESQVFALVQCYQLGDVFIYSGKELCLSGTTNLNTDINSLGANAHCFFFSFSFFFCKIAINAEGRAWKSRICIFTYGSYVKF